MTGLIGLGAMGSNMASTLLRAMQDLMVYDIEEKKVKKAAEQGAMPAEGIPSVIENSGTIILSLPSSEITSDVLETQLLPIIRQDQIVIDTGTTVVADICRLSAKFKEKGAALIDAPVSGGSVGSADGSLYMFAGGDKEAMKNVTDILDILAGSRFTYCGKSGNGQIVKAVNQLAMGIVDAAYLECAAFGTAAGVDVAVLRKAIGGSEGFRKHFADITGRIIDGQGDSICCKIPEYKYFLNEADRKGLKTPILSSLSNLVKDEPASSRDNMNRPYAPLWSLLNE